MSLIDQLKQLQIPGQHQSVASSSAKRVSILFDLHVASSLDNEAILNIGISGFEELISIDSVFSQFENFFLKDSLTFQRSTTTKEKNVMLQKNISSFLLLLSPYVMLKAAQKTLEWLLRRYEIHIHDKDALMMCILPYHETKMFARIIQVFGKTQSNDIWYWLVTAQQDGVGFNTQSLVKQCNNSRNLLHFIFKMAEEANTKLQLNPKSGLRHVFSFLGKIVTGVIEMQDVLSEDFVSNILPLLYTGLKSKTKDFVSAIYMIIGMLASKIQLVKDVLKAFLVAILKSMQTQWYEEGILCLTTIIALQEVKTISTKLFSNFLKLDAECLMKELVLIHLQFSIDQFINMLIPHLCDNYTANEKCVYLLDSIIDELQLNKNQRNLIVNKLVSETVNSSSKGFNDEYLSIIQKISKRFSLEFDQAVASLYKEFEEEKNRKKQKQLSLLVSKCLSNAKHEILDESNTPLVISLNHPEPKIRCLAVSKLFDVMREDIIMAAEDFYKNSLLARLYDDSYEVVNIVLNYSDQIFTLFEQEELEDILKHLHQRTDHVFNTESILIRALKNGNIQDNKTNDFTYMVLLQCLQAIATESKASNILDTLKTTPLMSSNPIISSLQESFKIIDLKSKNKNVVDSFIQVIKGIAQNIKQNDNCCVILEQFFKYISKLDVDHVLYFIFFLILSNTNSFHQFLDLAKFTENIKFADIKENSNKDTDSQMNDLVGEYLNHSDELSNAKISFVKSSFYIYLQKACDLIDDKESKRHLFQIICQQMNKKSSNHEILFKRFCQKCVNGKDDMINFITDVCCHLIDSVTEKDQQTIVVSLQIMSKLLEEPSEMSKELFSFTILTLISMLNNPLKAIRKISLKNIELFYKSTKKKRAFQWNMLLEDILKVSQEISLDKDYVRRIFQEFFKTEVSQKVDNPFAAFSSSKSSKGNSSLNMLKCYIEATSSFPSSSEKIQKNLFELLDLVSFRDVWGEVFGYLEVKQINIDNEKYLINTFVLIFDHLSRDKLPADCHDKIVKVYTQYLDDSKYTDLQAKAISMVDSPFFKVLSEKNQLNILSIVIKLLIASENVMKATLIRTTLKKLEWNSTVLCHFMQKFIQNFDTKCHEDISFLGTVDEKWEELRVLTEILEAVKFDGELDKTEKIVADLFSVFERILKLPPEAFDYHRQLCLSTFLSMLNSKSFKSFSPDTFKSELIITCLQTGQETSTNQLCLQVLGHAAALCPTQVLHNVMHIFTFMGNSLIKVDNEQTFKVIEQTIDSIVPVLIKDEDENLMKSKTKRKSSETKEDLILFILQTFIDSLPHCPEHRQLHIFTHLMHVMGEKSHLHTATIILLNKIVEGYSKPPSKDEEMELELTPITTEFCMNFLMQYPAYLLVNILKHLFLYLQELIQETSSPSKRKKQKEDPFKIKSFGEKSLKIFQSSVIMLASSIIKSEKITNAYHNSSSKRQEKSMTTNFSSLIEALLNLNEAISSQLSKSGNEKSLKFMEKLAGKIHRILLELQMLLPVNPFLKLFVGLIDNENVGIQKKALEMLCTKISTTANINEAKENLLVEVFEKVLPLLEDHSDGNKEILTLHQLVLYSIKVLSNILCLNHKKEFTDAIPKIISLFKEDDTNDLVFVNAILCVAEIVSLLKAHVLQYLPAIIKPLLLKIDFDIKEVEDIKTKAVLVSSFVVTLEKLLDAVPQFLSPYVDEILKRISLCSILMTDNTSIMSSLSNLQLKFGKTIPPRVLYKSIEKSFDNVAIDNVKYLLPVAKVLKHSFTAISKVDANENFSKNIVELLKKVFMLRSNCDDKEQIIDVENEVIESFCCLVLKLSENTLRPLYLELFTWSAKEPLNYKIAAPFYNLSWKLSETLKSLFLLFIGPVFKHAAELCSRLQSIEGDDNDDQTAIELLTTIVDMLNNCFRYDTQGFFTKDRFKLIVEALTDQLENKLLKEKYMNFVEDHLKKCIVNLAAAVNDVCCWKILNHAVLTKTKSDDAKVRLATLKVVYDIYERMGESYMILTPETIPFLPELLEDDSTEVEDQCKKVIKLIEDISGESMQKYF